MRPLVVRVTAWSVIAVLSTAGPVAAQPATSPEGGLGDVPTPAAAPTPSPSPAAAPNTLRMARATWDTGWFQAEVNRLLLERLGYVVEGPVTMTNASFYEAVAAGGVDLWANGWMPLHRELLEPGAETVGAQVPGGALQGYLVDQDTARELGIEDLGDLADPDVASAFDADGDGRADLIGCNVEWTCAATVEHHLDAYGLRDTVAQVQGEYGPLMREAIARHADGAPLLAYTFTPHWVLGALEPGEDVRWLQVPFASLPAAQSDLEDRTAVADVPGCPDQPCLTGWPPNDIVAVANADVLEAQPPLRRLLEVVEIPLADIAAQNARMVDGEGSPADIAAHAREWVNAHEGRVAEWLAHADPDGVVTGQRGADTGGGAPVGTLRVVTRQAPPFAIYSREGYRGFSVELAELVAARLGADMEVYGVDTVAKQLDDVARGAADLAVGGLAVTAAREDVVDFTQPVLDTGLQVMVPADDAPGLLARIASLARAILLSELPWLIALFVGVLLLTAHVMWLLERARNPDFAAPYRHGILDSFWWAVVTLTTVGYGDKAPRSWRGRGFAVVWMIAGYFLFASFTASITSTLAVDRLQGRITGPDDLPGATVAAVTGSPGDGYLAGEGLSPVLAADADEALALLADGSVDAVVHDAPVLRHHARTDGAGAVRVVGAEFERVRYAIAVPPGSPRREEINRAVLEVLESGAFARLHAEWFGGRG